MENGLKRVNICKGVNLSYIKNTKFKTVRLSFTMFLPLDKNWASKYAILPGILEKSCKLYPSLAELSKKLDDLYGAAIYSGVGKLGDFQVLTVSAVCINDKFSLDDKDIVKEVAHLLREVIFNPVLDDGRFKDEQVFQERRQLVELIDAEYNDKRKFARTRCEELMFAKQRFGINKYGKRSSVQSINSNDVTLAWKNALEKAKIEIMMIGDAEFDSVIDEFTDAFKDLKREEFEEIKEEALIKPDKVSEYKDIMNVTQSKLVMGFRTPIMLPDSKVPIMRVTAALLGGTPTSKLFTNVREKLSLCYYCLASYNKHKGVMTIESGVERKNILKAKQEILNQLKLIQTGDFSDEEFNDTKKYICQSFEKVKDSLGALDNWYVLQSMQKKINSPEDAIEEIKNVKREDVIKASKEIYLDTVYVLTDEEVK